MRSPLEQAKHELKSLDSAKSFYIQRREILEKRIALLEKEQEEYDRLSETIVIDPIKSHGDVCNGKSNGVHRSSE